MNKKILLLPLLAAFSVSAAAADTYVIEPTHTFANFEINHLGFSTSRGQFGGTSGTLSLDQAKKTGSVDVTFDLTQLNTGVPKLDEHLQGADFFDVAQYPTATFKSSTFKFDGDTLVAVDGELTLHGVTKPVSLDVTGFKCGEHPMTKKPHCGADAVTTIKRSDWGVSAYVPAVGDEVKLTIQVEADKK